MPVCRLIFRLRPSALAKTLLLEINGKRVELKPESQEIIFPPGAGGLPTMKIGILYKALLPEESNAGQYLINYRDGNFAGRAGWKEIIATAEPGLKFSIVLFRDRPQFAAEQLPYGPHGQPASRAGSQLEFFHPCDTAPFGQGARRQSACAGQQAGAAQLQSEGQYLSQPVRNRRARNGRERSRPSSTRGCRAGRKQPAHRRGSTC